MEAGHYFGRVTMVPASIFEELLAKAEAQGVEVQPGGADTTVVEVNVAYA